MRRLFAEGLQNTATLGRMFGVSQYTAWGIVKGSGWKHLK
jgi:hypothetical protein